MDIDDIPQDQSESYGGHKKIIYGTHGGHYQAATSSGWADEAYATALAVHELDAQTEAARAAVLRGEFSPLYYQMYRARHDVASLAAAGNGKRAATCAPPCSPNCPSACCSNTPTRSISAWRS